MREKVHDSGEKSLPQLLQVKEFALTLHSQSGTREQHLERTKARHIESLLTSSFGGVVQLVRIHACHAWGREFEPRPHRQDTNLVSKQKRWGSSVG